MQCTECGRTHSDGLRAGMRKLIAEYLEVLNSSNVSAIQRTFAEKCTALPFVSAQVIPTTFGDRLVSVTIR